MFQHLTVLPKPPSQLNSRLSSAIDAVILRALAKRADERFPTIKAFASALQQAFDYVDLRATLSITREEALQGASRTITLPSKRRVTVTIPPNVQHGQILHLPDQGMSYYDGGPRGSLQLTLSTAQTESMPQLVKGDEQDLPTVLASGKLGKQLSPAADANGPQSCTDEPVSVRSRVGSSPSLESGATLPSNNIVAEPPLGTMPSSYRDAPTLQQSGAMWPTCSANNNDKPSSRRTIVIAVVVLLLIISSVLTTVFVKNTIATNNAHATATVQARVQATATTIAANPDLDPYPPAGMLALVDSLSQPSSWSNYSDANWGGKCQFVNGAYQISQLQPNRLFNCNNSNTTYNNFAFEVKMTIKQGNCGGQVIRANSDNSDLYVFEVCQDGNYAFGKYTSDASLTVLTNGKSSAISQGIGQSNTIAVVANDGNFELYVNFQKIDSASDSAYSQGYIGLVADARNNATTVIYQNARVWKI
jgi:hypothetical protein